MSALEQLKHAGKALLNVERRAAIKRAASVNRSRAEESLDSDKQRHETERRALADTICAFA